ncbi:hypothetical protein EJD96_00205 (plasmid) [Herbaspirillum seropedicae]|uniref:hypothetical protein n=1 Tax=Herbaspirillum seropedicae TaxID=964 RepID=UPI0011201465|nr:hypothetical protein [Herbaspirillum seropedicae]QDD62672.1 hypothetical protein EJD96_00205 [Herbaspirillum seropedicae]
MAIDKTGGPAFPGAIAVGPHGEPVPAAFHGVAEGMTLRDYFATHAPIDLAWANDIFYKRNGRNAGWRETLEMLAELRGAYADLMVKERTQ